MSALGANLKRWSASLGPFIGLVVVVAFFTQATGEFGRLANGEESQYLSQENIRKLLNQTAIIGVISVGMTLVIIGGGIDLSVGSVVALSAVTVAFVVDGLIPSRLTSKFLPSWIPLWIVGVGTFAIFLGLHYRATRRLEVAKTILWGALWAAGCLALGGKGALAAAAAGAFVGLAFGHLNGLLITTTGVAPFIVTLGAMSAIRGVTERLSGETKVNVGDIVHLRAESPWLFNLMHSSEESAWFGVVTPGVLVFAAAAIAAGLLLQGTRLGRWIFAIGSNEEAARLSGVPTAAVKLWMYSLAGLLAGIGGVLQFSRLSGGDPAAGQGYELDAIAAVVIGGGSLRGGEGSVLGAILGTLLMGVLRNGCQFMDYPPSLQNIIIGCIIIAAVALDEARHRNRRQ